LLSARPVEKRRALSKNALHAITGNCKTKPSIHFWMKDFQIYKTDNLLCSFQTEFIDFAV
jgi:hypothetical protein